MPGITLNEIMALLENYYTKSELQTVEQSIVNAANLLSAPFQIGEIDSSGNYELDATSYKDWIIEEVTDACTINLNNTSNGDAGMLEVIIDSVGGHLVELGVMFTKKMGVREFNNEAGADNIISWRKVGEDHIVYTIAQIEETVS